MSKLKKILPWIAPIAAIALPALAPALMTSVGGFLGGGQLLGSALTGAALSGVGSAVQGKPVGQSLLSAALGGVGGGLAGGGGQALAGAAGLTGTGANVASGALTGAAYGGASGGLKGALTGAVGGGLMGGMAPAAEGVGGLTGNEPMSAMGSAGPMTTTANMSGLTTGTGLAAGGGTSALAGSGMNLKDALSLGSSLYSGYSGMEAQDEIQKQLMAAQQQSQAVLSPYTQAGATATDQLSDSLTKGFNYEDYANSPAYKFQLEQGQGALQQALAAQGMGQSGAAVKAAADYSQGLASQNYNDAYNQWLQQNSQLGSLGNTGLGAAGGMADVYGNIANIGASNTLAGTNSMNSMISGLSQNDLLKQALLRGTGSIFA